MLDHQTLTFPKIMDSVLRTHHGKDEEEVQNSLGKASVEAGIARNSQFALFSF